MQFLTGYGKSYNDLARAKCHSSYAIFVLPDIDKGTLRDEEDSVFLTAVALINYMNLFTYVV